MSECQRVSDLFGELHDDQVDGAIDLYARNHLHDCPGCREDFKWYGFTVQALNQLEKVSPPANFLSQLDTKLQTSSSFFDFFRDFFGGAPRIPLPVGAAALAFIAVMSIALYNHRPDVAPSMATSPGLEQLQPNVTSSGAGMAAADARRLRPKTLATSTGGSLYAMPGRGEFESVASHRFPTIADRIGADNFTVESSSIDNAVESLKRILPQIQGQLIDEKSRLNLGEKVIAVLIPSEAYGHLTTELINHGAVAAGATGPDISQAPAKKEGNNVLLYIRFIHTQ